METTTYQARSNHPKQGACNQPIAVRPGLSDSGRKLTPSSMIPMRTPFPVMPSACNRLTCVKTCGGYVLFWPSAIRNLAWAGISVGLPPFQIISGLGFLIRWAGHTFLTEGSPCKVFKSWGPPWDWLSLNDAPLNSW